ncbi:uncharacterized protein G2W53_027469 [Senna tora]|uniref:Retrotransposon gag domain-containing protein n=1 Tax=Senna tora TaxID=362788 RepID=A0A834TQW0_9FABA|nr:uncharacterized protein G2W53_027469 [Senna tora]
MENENNHKIYEYATPTIHLLSPSIRRPAIEVNHFEINPNIIQLFQSHASFGGLPTEDSIAHILNFLEVCDTFKQNRVSEEAIKLRLFPFSLRDRAKWWLNSLPAGFITTWEDLANKFLAKYFPPAWERFKDLLQRCPHHGFPKWLHVQTFYNGLHSTFQTTIDASAGGSLMEKPMEVAYNFLETIALNRYHWQSERHMPRSATEINKVEVINALCAQIVTLTKQVHSLRVQASVDAISSFISCELCGAKHLYDQCPEISKFEHYTSNASWFNALSSSQESKAPPPLVEIVSLRNLETQLEYLAKTLNNQPHGGLPSNIELNPRSNTKEHNKAITLTSEKEMEGNLGTEKVDKEPVEETTIIEGCFEDCVGAIDGTHIRVKVSLEDAPEYRGRKDFATQNVLATCSFDLRFTYVLCGWEGTASDLQVLKNALCRSDPLNVPTDPDEELITELDEELTNQSSSQHHNLLRDDDEYAHLGENLRDSIATTMWRDYSS